MLNVSFCAVADCITTNGIGLVKRVGGKKIVKIKIILISLMQLVSRKVLNRGVVSFVFI